MKKSGNTMDDQFQIQQELNKAVHLHRLGNIGPASEIYNNILKIDPKNPDALNFLGVIAYQIGQYDKSVFLITKAIHNNPSNHVYYCNLGNTYKKIKSHYNAIESYRKALDLAPNDIISLKNMGLLLFELGQLDQAVHHFDRVLKLNPYDIQSLSHVVLYMQETCEWQFLKENTDKLNMLIKEAVLKGMKDIDPPFNSLMREIDPALNFEIAKSVTYNIADAVIGADINFHDFEHNSKPKTRLTIGYLSYDFRNHAVAHLMLGLFGMHDRKSFNVFCYSYGADDDSFHRNKIRNDCDRFIDIKDLSDGEAAKVIYNDKVDILVDLMGHTKKNRIKICSFRPAPVQVTFLGYPGTTGSDFIDYIITDKIVTPNHMALFFSEKFVYMPHCYQVNDRNQPISDKRFSRVESGLPADRFVFCSFTQAFKIEPEMFDVWMKILDQVPGSVLWLLKKNDLADKNLKKEAYSRGISPERLIFADRCPKDEHLARHKLADLCLDTRIYNGHTTTSDALWAGTPVVAIKGESFPSSVSASILSSIGLPELITYNLEEFETLAVRLAHNPEELDKVRQTLALNRLKAPLFDTSRYVNNLEKAYHEMWEIFSTKKKTREITVVDSIIDDEFPSQDK